jgi:hypothetical protein
LLSSHPLFGDPWSLPGAPGERQSGDENEIIVLLRKKAIGFWASSAATVILLKIPPMQFYFVIYPP